MKKRLNCRQVDALITFYKEGCLTDLLRKYVEEHLETCPECRAKYFNESTQESLTAADNYQLDQYELFKTNLSAYIDNELQDNENIKIKKIAISNPKAREELENSYKFKQILHSAFEKTKNDIKIDFSKDILKIISNNSKKTDPFYKIAATFLVMIVFLVISLIKILYF